ncbi:MAG TPA: hypothetical protein PLS73_09085 [Saprospiraceae bacterium]|nr:hypothetical protein [Saprospiraceae bacterium]
MKNLLKAIQIPFILMLTLVVSNASNPNWTNSFQGRWEQLGSRTVKFGMDRDEIMVTATEGFFTGLKIRVTNSALNMHKMVIHFGDGTTQDVELKNNFRAGQESRVIDLAGNRRVITKVVFWYDTKNARQTKAVVELWGKH